MTQFFIFPLLVFLIAANGFCSAIEETVTFGRFGKVTLYHNSPQPSHVVLFVSGDGGWNLGVIDMAKTLSSLDALVAGIDITHYLAALDKTTEKCSYPASDFELLSKFIQKKLNFPRYVPPVLVGYSSGATLVYATVAQAPPQTFRGAVSMGFCPDLPLTKPLCRGNGLEWKAGPKGKGYSFLPVTNLEVPWIVLQGTIDQVCNVDMVKNYVAQVKNGELMLLPQVGHGFSVQRNWLPQFKRAFALIVQQKESESYSKVDELKDLPLIEVPSRNSTSNFMAVFLTGDGGWGVTDRGISNALAEKRIPVVGLNSLHYFWHRRTPDSSAKDLDRIIKYYQSAWKKEKSILVGYSLGADVLPFMIDRLPHNSIQNIYLIVLIGPSPTVDFQFSLTDWLGDFSRKTSLPVLPEIEKLKETKILCFYGEDEKDTLCRSIVQDNCKIIPLKGGHRIGAKYEPIVDAIVREIKENPD